MEGRDVTIVVLVLLFSLGLFYGGVQYGKTHTQLEISEQEISDVSFISSSTSAQEIYTGPTMAGMITSIEGNSMSFNSARPSASPAIVRMNVSSHTQVIVMQRTDGLRSQPVYDPAQMDLFAAGTYIERQGSLLDIHPPINALVVGTKTSEDADYLVQKIILRY